MPEKYYVSGLDRDTNSVIVARGKGNPTLFARGLSVLASEFNWVAGSPPTGLVVDPGHRAGAEAAEMPTKQRGGAVAEGQVSGDGRDTKPREAAAAAERARIGERREVEGEVGREETGSDFRCLYRCRHRQDLRPCAVEVLEAEPSGGRTGGADTAGLVCHGSDGSGDDEQDGSLRATSVPPSRSMVSVRFDEPARAIAPGQIVALYKDGVCLGGGAIFRAEDHCAPVLVRTPPTVSPPLPLPQPGTKRRRPRQRSTGRGAL